MSHWQRDTRNPAGLPDWPRVVIVHSFYRSGRPSGENDTCVRQFSLLAEAGVNVTLLSVSTDKLRRSPLYTLRTAARVTHHGGLSPMTELRALRPDVVHIFNLFPNIDGSWIRKVPVGVVATLHNYRALCAAGTLSRDGQPCSKCALGNTVPAVMHGCYQGSRLATLPMALRNAGGAWRDPVLTGADLLIAPSRTVVRAYPAFEERMRLVTEPTDDPVEVSPGPRRGFIYLGRLDPEKGVLQMLECWPRDLPLQVVGDGALMAQARAIAESRNLEVTFHGFIKDPIQKSRLLQTSEALVFPSTWREGAPLVYAEAMAAGLPVIALEGNAVAEAVVEHRTGIVINEMSNERLSTATAQIQEHSSLFRAACEETYQQTYRVAVWLSTMRATYLEAATRRKALRPAVAGSGSA